MNFVTLFFSQWHYNRNQRQIQLMNRKINILLFSIPLEKLQASQKFSTISWTFWFLNLYDKEKQVIKARARSVGRHVPSFFPTTKILQSIRTSDNPAQKSKCKNNEEFVKEKSRDVTGKNRAVQNGVESYWCPILASSSQSHIQPLINISWRLLYFCKLISL